MQASGRDQQKEKDYSPHPPPFSPCAPVGPTRSSPTPYHARCNVLKTKCLKFFLSLLKSFPPQYPNNPNNLSTLSTYYIVYIVYIVNIVYTVLLITPFLGYTKRC